MRPPPEPRDPTLPKPAAAVRFATRRFRFRISPRRRLRWLWRVQRHRRRVRIRWRDPGAALSRRCLFFVP